MKRAHRILAIYNKYNVHQTTALLSALIVCYNDSYIRAYFGIYHNHWWVSFLGNRQEFGGGERGDARWFQQRH